MRILICIIVILVFLSCKNNDANKVSESSVLDAEYEAKAPVFNIDTKVDTYQNLSIQKLQGYFDLIKLKEKHPEFKNDILQQLRELSNDSIPNYKGDFSIENIHQIGDAESVSDSVQKIKLAYHVVSDSYKGIDSIIVVITSKRILIDETNVISNKVTFTKP